MKRCFLRLAKPRRRLENLTFVSCKDEEIFAASSSILNVAQTREEIPASFQKACHRLPVHPASCFAPIAMLALRVLLYFPLA